MAMTEKVNSETKQKILQELLDFTQETSWTDADCIRDLAKINALAATEIFFNCNKCINNRDNLLLEICREAAAQGVKDARLDEQFLKQLKERSISFFERTKAFPYNPEAIEAHLREEGESCYSSKVDNGTRTWWERLCEEVEEAKKQRPLREPEPIDPTELLEEGENIRELIQSLPLYDQFTMVSFWNRYREVLPHELISKIISSPKRVEIAGCFNELLLKKHPVVNIKLEKALHEGVKEEELREFLKKVKTFEDKGIMDVIDKAPLEVAEQTFELVKYFYGTNLFEKFNTLLEEIRQLAQEGRLTTQKLEQIKDSYRRKYLYIVTSSKIFTIFWTGKHSFIGDTIANGRLVRYASGIGYFKLSEDGKTITRFSGSGRKSWSYTFKKPGEYRVGPRYAHRVIKPEDEPDPIKKVLREEKVGLSKVRWMKKDEILESFEFFCDIRRAYPPGTSTRVWKTDGKVEVLHSEVKSMEHINQYCDPEVRCSVKITNATYAICVGNYVQMNGVVVKRLWEVAIWPNCDPQQLKKILESF